MPAVNPPLRKPLGSYCIHSPVVHRKGGRVPTPQRATAAGPTLGSIVSRETFWRTAPDRSCGAKILMSKAQSPGLLPAAALKDVQ